MDRFVPSLQMMIKGTAASVAGGAALGAGLLYYGQSFLIYPSGFPQGSRQTVSTPLEYEMIYHDITLETSDNIRIKAYLMLQRTEVPNVSGAYAQSHIYFPPKRDGTFQIPVDEDMDEADLQVARSRPTVIIFHANAGNLGHRLPLARIFYDRMKCNVFILSYRGYGLSEGRPSESGLRKDAQTALDFVLEHPLLKHTPIVLFGQSIGGAVSIDLASRNPDPIRGLILENTFLSIPELIPTVLPYLTSVSFLCHQIWPSSDSIRKIPTDTPMLMLSGLQDELVPPVHMKRLWKIVTSQGGVGEEEEKEVSDEEEGEDEEQEKKALGRKWRKIRKGVKWWMEFADGMHNTTCVTRDYWEEVAAFVKQFSPAEQLDG